MLEAYGAWGKKSMYGKTFMGIIRSTVLIGPDGRIARIWPKVKVDGHAAGGAGGGAGALTGRCPGALGCLIHRGASKEN